MEKIDEGAYIIYIEEILEPRGVEIIDIESEKISWLDLIIEYAFVAQRRGSLSFEKAMNGLEKEEWKKVIHEEYCNINDFSTFPIVSTLPDIILINKKNVLYKKHDRKGNLACYKAKYIV